MAWTDPTGWPVAKLINDDWMNLHVRDNFLALYGAPVCRLDHSVSQSVSQGENDLVFDTELDDDFGMHNTGQEEINFSHTGMWWLTGYVEFSADPDGYRYARIGGIVKQFGAVAGGVAFGISLGGMEFYTDAQQVALHVAHAAGNSLTISSHPQFAAQWLSGG